MTDGLFDNLVYKPPGFVDFAGLPPAVFPTSVKLLEQGGDILVYREADLAKGITRKQNAIFRRLVKAGESAADCKFTVLVVTGLAGGAGRTQRTMAVYDAVTVADRVPSTRPATTADVQRFISGWFNDRKGAR